MLSYRQFINEGGNAIKTKVVSRIKREYIDATIKKTIKTLAKYGLSAASTRPIGSTGKKVDSGDIDLAVMASPVSAALNTSDLKSTLAELAKHIKAVYGEAHVAFGNTISFPVPIEGSEGYAQMDFMFTDDLDRSSFAYHAPTPEESKSGGAQRSELLMAIAMFHGGRNQNPNQTEYERHWMDTISGKLIRGTEKVVGSKRTASDKTPLNLSPDGIVKELLGREFSVSDTNSVETTYAALKKSKNFSPATKKEIIKLFKNALLNKKLKVPTGLR